VRNDYARAQNAGAWGYMIADAPAADDPATAESVLEALNGKKPPEWMKRKSSASVASTPRNGRAADAVAEMQKLRKVVPGATLLGHRALLQERARRLCSRTRGLWWSAGEV